MVFTLVRALTYATIFVGFLGVFLPARILAWAGLTAPDALEAPQVGGIILVAAGAAFALWCILAFVLHRSGYADAPGSPSSSGDSGLAQIRAQPDVRRRRPCTDRRRAPTSDRSSWSCTVPCWRSLPTSSSSFMKSVCFRRILSERGTTRIAGTSGVGCLAYDESDRMNVTRYETADAFLRGSPAAAHAGRSGEQPPAWRGAGHRAKSNGSEESVSRHGRGSCRRRGVRCVHRAVQARHHAREPRTDRGARARCLRSRASDSTA